MRSMAFASAGSALAARAACALLAAAAALSAQTAEPPAPSTNPPAAANPPGANPPGAAGSTPSAAPSPSSLPATSAAAPLPRGAPRAMAAIDRDELKEHATFLASDALGGRYTGSEGQRKAADYIAARFEALQLEPLGDKDKSGKRGYLQSWPLERIWLDPKDTVLRFGEQEARGGFAVIPGKDLGKVKVQGELAFCGDGSPDEMPRSLKGKIPIVVLAEGGASGPRAEQASVVVVQRAAAINREAEKRGAKAVVFCLRSPSNGLANSFNYSALLPGKPMLSFGHERGRRFGEHKVPSLFTGDPLSKALLAVVGGGDGKAEAGSKAEPGAKAGKGAVRGTLELSIAEDKSFHAVNVVAALPGADPTLAKEAIVYSAHMDHMGTRLDGDPFNGADDNASGTSGVLEIAQAFAQATAAERPARTIVFLSVSGEEEGLWGSAYFADNPSWPLQRIAADINIDMIGRSTDLSGPNAISVTPSHDHAYYSTLVRTAAQLALKMDMTLTSGDIYYERSDHYNFAKKDVPVVFFCDGEHADYHQVTDHADKLDYAKMERVARLAFWTGFEAAQTKARPERLGNQKDW